MVNKLSKGYNLRWESSRMMLPEHVEALLEQKRENKKIPKPTIDEQQFIEIGYVVMSSLRAELTIRVTIWKDGQFIHYEGIVEKVDHQMKYIIIYKDEDEFERLWISDITGAAQL